HVAAAGAMLSWLLAETLKHGKATALGAASGLVAGLVVITPCAGFVSPMSSLWIGLIGGVVCFGGVLLKGKLGYDDSLDAFGVHGIGGIVGGLLLGVFADTAWNEGGANGLLLGDSALFVANLKATVIGVAFAALGTFIILKIL